MVIDNIQNSTSDLLPSTIPSVDVVNESKLNSKLVDCCLIVIGLILVLFGVAFFVFTIPGVAALFSTLSGLLSVILGTCLLTLGTAFLIFRRNLPGMDCQFSHFLKERANMKREIAQWRVEAAKNQKLANSFKEKYENKSLSEQEGCQDLKNKIVILEEKIISLYNENKELQHKRDMSFQIEQTLRNRIKNFEKKESILTHQVRNLERIGNKQRQYLYDVTREKEVCESENYKLQEELASINNSIVGKTFLTISSRIKQSTQQETLINSEEDFLEPPSSTKKRSKTVFQFLFSESPPSSTDRHAFPFLPKAKKEHSTKTSSSSEFLLNLLKKVQAWKSNFLLKVFSNKHTSSFTSQEQKED
ncbi:DUF308 domain-containing protein [Candidatus Chlamydia sanziniae]|uniref:IncA family protein n=1 Tax=Candidatus Chlamydia sanziniae TaxID=1806891 RepID=A0A1A9HY96_9CHLA|nr:DUF308 domain-containing protein [Candidatus Chlamydia sanziniae]ANH79014.1 hypothetical protein Cs308_0844 [Candidatus Chlamydia sanziniae]